jgi:DUF3099 family protein
VYVRLVLSAVFFAVWLPARGDREEVDRGVAGDSGTAVASLRRGSPSRMTRALTAELARWTWPWGIARTVGVGAWWEEVVMVYRSPRDPGEGESPVLITEAAPSYDDEHAARKRKYMVMMGLRFPCLILAGIFYHTWWLALLFVVLSIPLPWVAVLIANDRPPRRAEQVNRYQREAKAIEGRGHPVIDG